MCNACFNDKKIKSTTTFTIDCNGSLIVVKNVPCMECETCGETELDDAVLKRLEEIVKQLKTVLQDVSVVDYEKVA